ncbi:SCO family protein [Pusillimonas sp.]|uniref:SCO family protein n=1 Tax=Pusillimonas sp. TaxID=3040095 RepID=UPI0037CACB96
MSSLFSLRNLFSALALCGTLALAGCGGGDAEFRGSDISGSKLGADLAMVDDSGQPRTLDDYKGKVLVAFFGFTQCPDVCPTSMSQLAHAMELLEDDADQVQVLMITVDPERDTPEVLSSYVKAFDPTFVGLTGTTEQLAATAKSFRTFYAKVPGTTPDDYTMDHGASFYVMDKSGDARVLLRPDAPADDLVHDIRELL